MRQNFTVERMVENYERVYYKIAIKVEIKVKIMADFKFLEDPVSKKWVILAPRRAKRPDIAKISSPLCPFCIGREKDEPELYRILREAIEGQLAIGKQRLDRVRANKIVQ